MLTFDVIDQSSSPLFAELVLLPFLITYQIRKAFIFNKNAGNEQNLETQVFNIIVFIRFG